jgi:acyl-CoA hydrolase
VCGASGLREGQPTLVLGGGDDLAEQLDEVGQVIAQELCFEDEVLASVIGVQFGPEELGFADNA